MASPLHDLWITDALVRARFAGRQYPCEWDWDPAAPPSAMAELDRRLKALNDEQSVMVLLKSVVCVPVPATKPADDCEGYVDIDEEDVSFIDDAEDLVEIARFPCR
jgi:hypothetical protein